MVSSFVTINLAKEVWVSIYGENNDDDDLKNIRSTWKQRSVYYTRKQQYLVYLYQNFWNLILLTHLID